MLPADAIDFYSFFGYGFKLLAGYPTGLEGASLVLLQAAVWVTIIGLTLALVLLILLVYVSITLEQFEHHGFHHLEMAEHIVHEAHVEEAKNPRWEGVVVLANSPNESDWRRAILEADILLSDMLVGLGYPGETLADKLKMANPIQFTTLDIAWEAHRMRNALAHLGEAFPLSERDARATIDQYRRVFEEFDYI